MILYEKKDKEKIDKKQNRKYDRSIADEKVD
jgi:hypothetical protein